MDHQIAPLSRTRVTNRLDFEHGFNPRPNLLLDCELPRFIPRPDPQDSSLPTCFPPLEVVDRNEPQEAVAIVPPNKLDNAREPLPNEEDFALNQGGDMLTDRVQTFPQRGIAPNKYRFRRTGRNAVAVCNCGLRPAYFDGEFMLSAMRQDKCENRQIAGQVHNEILGPLLVTLEEPFS